MCVTFVTSWNLAHVNKPLALIATVKELQLHKSPKHCIQFNYCRRAIQKLQITACLPKLQSGRPKSRVLIELNPWSVWQGQSAAKSSRQEELTVMSSDSCHYLDDRKLCVTVGRDEAKMFSALSHQHLVDFEHIPGNIIDAAFVNATTIVGVTCAELVPGRF